MENFWGRRFAALLVDIVIITLLLWIISSLIFLLMAGLGSFLCSKLLDFYWGNFNNSLFHLHGG